MTFSRLPSQLDLSDYKCVELYERSGPSPGNVGVLIFVRLHRDLAEAEERILDRARESIVDAIDREDARHDPRQAERAIDHLNSFKLVFTQPIYVEPIPNGYCSQACCSQIPWYIITTAKGRIKIGWRKSVIHLEWTDSAIKGTAAEIFPKEEAWRGYETTAYDKVIHAHGYEAATRYIQRLLNA